jgi:N-acetylglucosaminyldiphosphoundecaprenol N-acetyl-beta-D-mannosaminyltransferase
MHRINEIESKILDWSHLCDLILSNEGSKNSPNFITYLNPYTATLTYSNIYNYNDIDGFVLDGIITTKLFNLFNRRSYQTLSFDFSHIAGDTFELISKNKLKLAIIGANNSELNKFVDLLKSKYSDLNICFSRDGYFNIDTEINTLVDALNLSQPAFIMLSMGSPLQEKLGILLRGRLKFKTVIMTCGAFVSQTASSGKESYYPYLIDKLSLRWLYRLYKEKHIRMRWIKYYPKFVIIYPILKISSILQGFLKK